MNSLWIWIAGAVALAGLVLAVVRGRRSRAAQQPPLDPQRRAAAEADTVPAEVPAPESPPTDAAAARAAQEAALQARQRLAAQRAAQQLAKEQVAQEQAAREQAERERAEREQAEREQAREAAAAEAQRLAAEQVRAEAQRRREAAEAQRLAALQQALQSREAPTTAPAPKSEPAPARATVSGGLAPLSRPPAALPAPPAEPPLVLVADDSKVVRVKLGRLLSQQGYRVALAEDGEQAWHQLAQQAPQLLITDVEMPGLDGFGLTRRLRADPRWARLPVVMITSADERHRAEARAAGVDVVLGKPYGDDELLAQLRTLVSVHPTPALAS